MLRHFFIFLFPLPGGRGRGGIYLCCYVAVESLRNAGHAFEFDPSHACAENPDYAGYIIPPAPPRPDFDASREKLQKLGEAESGQLTKVRQFILVHTFSVIVMMNDGLRREKGPPLPPSLCPSIECDHLWHYPCRKKHDIVTSVAHHFLRCRLSTKRKICSEPSIFTNSNRN